MFLSLDRARSFLGLEGVSAIEVKVDDPFEAESLAADFRREFYRVKFESWRSRNRELLTALNRRAVRPGSSSSSCSSPSRSASPASWASPPSRSRARSASSRPWASTTGTWQDLFLIQGLALGVGGSIIGIGLGYVIGLAFLRFFGTGAFGLQLEAFDLIVPAVLARVGSAVASVIPARKASRLSPIEVIRNG